MKINELIASDQPEVTEMAISLKKDEPNNPTIHGHKGANQMDLKSRIMQARGQLKDLAKDAESDSLVVWESICKKVKGGMFMSLEQNIEQIRHGIEELAKTRKKGGPNSRDINKNIGVKHEAE
jgi:hypothetical protein